MPPAKKRKLEPRKGKQHAPKAPLVDEGSSGAPTIAAAKKSSKGKQVGQQHVVKDGAWVEMAPEPPRKTRGGTRLEQPASSAQRGNAPSRDKSPIPPPRRPGAKKQRSPREPARGSPSSASPDAVPAAPKRLRKAPATPPNAARTAAAVVGAAAEAQAHADALDALSRGVQTRRTAVDAERRMRAERARIERGLAASKQLLREKEGDLLQLLSNPHAAWDDEVFWQLAMCEFVLVDIDDDDAASLKPRQLGACFRALAAKARHGAELPRFRGLHELHALRAVLMGSERLCRELSTQLRRFKRLYCSMLSGFGRFRRVDPLPEETLLGLMQRTHELARKWRPPGNPGKSTAIFELPVSKAGGVYASEWRDETNELYHTVAGKTLSLRGTRSVAIAGSKRYLKSIPEEQRPAIESHETIRLHDIQAWSIQRKLALDNSFSKRRNTVQWDEATLNKLAWVVVTLTCLRIAAMREREVIGTMKLGRDADGHSKTGVNVCAAILRALVGMGIALHTVDFCCSDGTASNSSITIESGRHKGGSFAHLWTAMRACGHVLCFFILCLSHVTNNEVHAVCKAAGLCKRQHLLRHKGKRDPEKSKERLMLIELLSDAIFAIKSTEGCKNYIRVSEGLDCLGDPPGGAETRWLYWVYAAAWLKPATGRLELIVCFLLHQWLKAQGSTGLAAAEMEEGDCALSGAALLEKIESLKDDARRELLLELLNPEVRVWLCFLEIYGARSADRFIKFTENDAVGGAFKAGRVLRQKLSYLDALGGSDDSLRDLERRRPWKDDFEPLRKMVKERKAAFEKVDPHEIVRKGAKAAAKYFRDNTTAWRTNPALVALGTMDENGTHARQSAQELMALAKQGRKGIAQAMLPHLPDTANAGELEQAIVDATDGVGLFFQDEALDVFRTLAESKTPRRLVDVEGGSELRDVLWRVGCFVPIGNFFSETVVKTLSRDLHGTQRKFESCATRLTAARHRSHVYKTTAADWSAASAQQGHNTEKRVTIKPGIEEELQPITMDSEVLSNLIRPRAGEEPQEDEEADDEGGADESAEEEGDEADKPEGRAPGWPLEKNVKVATIRKALSVDGIVEVLWGYGQDGEPRVYLARITKLMKIKIKIRWLHEIEPDLYADCPFYTDIESWSMKQLWDTCSETVEETGAEGERRWRRPAAAADEADATPMASRSKWAELLEEAAANPGDDEDSDEEEEEEDAWMCEAGMREAEVEPPEPELHGRATQRLGSAGYLSAHDQEWYSDSILGNGHAIDARPDDEAWPVRYNYPRGSAWAARIFHERPGQRVLNACDCVLIQQICDGVHWHNLVLIGPQKLAIHWDPMGSDVQARAHKLAAMRRAFDAVPKADGWRLESLQMKVQTDGYQCGPWAHWFRCRVFAYCSNADVMASQAFADFLKASDGVMALNGLRGARADAAARANTALMHDDRVRLRQLLRAGARRGTLPWGSALQDAFRRSAAKADEPATVFVDLDEGLEGDDKYNPIVIDD